MKSLPVKLVILLIIVGFLFISDAHAAKSQNISSGEIKIVKGVRCVSQFEDEFLPLFARKLYSISSAKGRIWRQRRWTILVTMPEDCRIKDIGIFIYDRSAEDSRPIVVSIIPLQKQVSVDFQADITAVRAMKLIYRHKDD